MPSVSRRSHPTSTVGDFCRVMETIAPTALAQGWDNVGLLAGDPDARATKALLCIDLTRDVVDDAISKKANVVMAYHPPIFKPISTLRADSSDTDAVVFRCIAHGIAIYSTHTALDAADGGTNDVIAALCGIEATEPLEYVDRPGSRESKVITFVTEKDVEAVASAMFAAGAGTIGDYTKCSFRTAGQGTFFGGATTNPTLGQRGRMEFVDEVRLEAVVPNAALPDAIAALRHAHPYDEPAFDIVPLAPRPVRGIGRAGMLPEATTLNQLARRLKRKTHATCIQTVGESDAEASRAVIVVGAAGSLPFQAGVGSGDVIITGEIRHHDALTIRRSGCSAIALGHWASEHPTLAILAERLTKALPGVTVSVSSADADPFLAA